MDDLFHESDSLPPGLWVVKWIDFFKLSAMRATSASVILQRLYYTDVSEIERLTHEQVGHLLGRAPEEPLGWGYSTEIRQLLVGALPIVNLGDVIRGHQRVGKLAQRERSITLQGDIRRELSFVEQEHAPVPPGWPGTMRYRVLNWFEYEIRGEVAAGSRCWCFQVDGIEYLIPATVIFKTFYGFHTLVAKAFCKKAWDEIYDELISTARPASGLGTYVDPLTGTWNIVVRAGLTQAHAFRLAPLRFDDFARGRANAVYSSSLVHTSTTRSDRHRQWHVNAEVPYRWNDHPLTLRVQGFPLRPYDLSSPRGSTRFLVTRIDATSWPFPDQQIATAVEHSHEASDDPNPERVDRPFKTWSPAPVVAYDDAQITQSEDPRSDSAQNRLHADDFEFLGPAPKHVRQKKTTHKQYQGRSAPPSDPPSPQLSAGNPVPGKRRPGQLVAETHERHHVYKLHFLLNALDSLKDDGAIAGYEIVSPPDDSHLREYRENVPCWSLLEEEQAEALAAGKHGKLRGWEYVFLAPLGGVGARRRAYARCVLVLRIHHQDREIVWFEIETRNSDKYNSYACEPSMPLTEASIASVLMAFREHEGRLPKKRLGEIFQELTGGRPQALEHRYLTDKVSKRTSGLQVDWLLSRLDLVLSQN